MPQMSRKLEKKKGVGVDARILSDVMGGALPLDRYEQLLPAYETMCRTVGVRTINQAAMIAAQIGTETGGLRWQEELASGDAYENRTDLGNTEPGDGRRFKGHGWIQITGRANHAGVSRWAYNQKLVPTETFFVDFPERLASDEYCWVGPAWYFTQARAGFMDAAARGDVVACTRMVNGGLNGLADRQDRYEKALRFGEALLFERSPVEEHLIDYPRDKITQDTGYFCGPASTQTVIRGAVGALIDEQQLAAQLGTHVGGTDYIGQFPAVLNTHIPRAEYRHRDVPNYPSSAAKETMWREIVHSINGDWGVVANFVAPPSNYPRAVPPSAISPAYSGGTIYHYVAVMGYRDDGQRKLWIADSGFRPYGYWLAFDQFCTLLVPKGYAYATAALPKTQSDDDGGIFMSLSDAEQKELLALARDIKAQLTGSSALGKYPGWEQLGKTASGADLTLVDGVAAVRKDIAGLAAKLGEK